MSLPTHVARTGPDADRHGLLERGHNCDAIRRANRFTTLFDGAAHFATLRAALARARDTVFIVGWDIDSRTRLVPDGAGTNVAV